MLNARPVKNAGASHHTRLSDSQALAKKRLEKLCNQSGSLSVKSGRLNEIILTSTLMSETKC